MRFGFRMPSPKRTLKAMTTGRVKRAVKRSVNPFYGRPGVGFIKNPRRSVRSAIYHRITFGWRDLFRKL